jgi:hypothetical protein
VFLEGSKIRVNLMRVEYEEKNDIVSFILVENEGPVDLPRQMRNTIRTPLQNILRGYEHEDIVPYNCLEDLYKHRNR